ncbi:MAG: hypothetical protein ACOY33_03230 [Pseudomonadota bacterium]
MAVILEHSVDLPAATSSDIKSEGWPALVRKVYASGLMAITTNRRREVVVMEAEVYDRLVDELTSLRKVAHPSIAELEAGFAQRIARMKEPAVDAHLRELFSNPVDHQGTVRVGRGN